MKNKLQSDKYLMIADHYRKCIDQHGDSHLGVDWPKVEDVNKRYQVMLEILQKDRSPNIALLDFGCGTSHLYEYMQQHGYGHLRYAGLDILDKSVEVAKKKYPKNAYYCLDILNTTSDLPMFDYIVMNGVFTQKAGLSSEEMFSFLKRLLSKIFLSANKGTAFNVMSKQVDWEKEGNFHLGLDIISEYITKELSQNFVIRHDYGLHEYTVYVYK